MEFRKVSMLLRSIFALFLGLQFAISQRPFDIGQLIIDSIELQDIAQYSENEKAAPRVGRFLRTTMGNVLKGTRFIRGLKSLANGLKNQVKMKKQGKPNVHDELKGFDIKINEFGEMQSSFNIDKLNDFLNDNVEDKKLGNEVQEEE